MVDRRPSDDEVIAAVAAQLPGIEATTAFVHGHPELAHEERSCSSYLVELLRDGGFSVSSGVAGMETAFEAVLATGRRGGRVGLVALYDAVAAVRPDGSIEPVHSCGHGPIAAAVSGAALALAGLREQLAGELVVIGCPADEIHAPGTISRGGGKALTAEAGLWDDVDAALYAHPEFKDTVWRSSRWMRRDSFLLAGLRSLRDDVAQPPIEGLAELLDACAKVSRRDLMIENVELDGDVEEDTGLVLRGSLLFFGDDEEEIERSARQIRAALPEAAWRDGSLVTGVRPDERVAAAVAEAFAAAGRGFEPEPGQLPFATDFGNISRRAPAALIGIGRPGGWAFHTDEGAEQFASQAGIEAALETATVLALSAARLLAEPS